MNGEEVFPVETDISLDDRFFCRIHQNHYKPKEKRFTSAAFKRDTPDDFSANWERYSTAESTRIDTTLAVVAYTQRLCQPLNLTIKHTPIQPWQEHGPNQAHSDICGEKTEHVINGLKNIAMTNANLAWRRPGLILATD